MGNSIPFFGYQTSLCKKRQVKNYTVSDSILGNVISVAKIGTNWYNILFCFENIITYLLSLYAYSSQISHINFLDKRK